jgi:ribonuclease BN (tRNA processing enzyme)
VNGVRVEILGAGDAFGADGRLQTCFRLAGRGDGSLLVDCGATSLVGMKRAGVDPSGVGWVALSHLHGDHFGGLPYLVLDGQFSRRERPLVVAGPAGVRERVEAAMEVAFPGSTSVARRFVTEFVELADRTPAVLGLATITPFEVVHQSGAPSFALRVEYGGRVVAYSGDTEWTEALVEAARGADLFLCEAYTFDKRVPYHLDYRTLLEHRDRIECERIVLTHMSGQMLSRLSEVELECAHEGMVIELPET